ncbi:hypothetical protein NitYY0826_C0803 [Nitratiruptor sp. YY08-26]|uniref:tetratricopeptide repeat protein n=1 Tax=unclassified Nitratiruptor TaxID=2624044 RepID=UPI001915A6DE|nr:MULTISPECIES: tetratricopeptide repeat protein [unclassified Nitratiruptor]BCD61936.1 hypothetical protein NitYY0813_C0801 [Nitratiruptor sp. YY08-13]BCD65871.1 hypothetical protein NitYY0826_C0803 [Nitratiruptor sp. YY08-26]
MSTKDNIEYIKKELDSEEKFLESVIKAEKFYKKHKKKITALVVLVVIGFLGYVGYDMMKTHNLEVSNAAYNSLLQNPQDKEALQTLKNKNPKLYALYIYQKAIEKSDIEALQKIANGDDRVLGDLAKYHIAVIKKDNKALERYANNSDAILRDFAYLDSAYMDFMKDAIAVGRKKIENIDKSSAAYPYALLLGHYGAKVKK